MEGGLSGTGRLSALGGMGGGGVGGGGIERELLSISLLWPTEATVSCSNTGLAQLSLELVPEASLLTTFFLPVSLPVSKDRRPYSKPYVLGDGAVNLDLSLTQLLDP